MINEGRYDAKILDHGFNEKTKGPQFWVSFETNTNEKITGFFSLTDRAAEYTIKKIRAMGHQGDSLEELGSGYALRGNLCSITVKHEEYQGKVSAKVAYVDPLGYEGGMLELEHDDRAARNASRFDVLLRKEPKQELARVGDPEQATPAQQYDERNPPPQEDNFNF